MWRWVFTINIMYNPAQQEGPAPHHPGPGARALGHQGGRVTHRVWQEQMRQGSRHRVPRTRGQRPPQGENMATAPETPKLGRVHRGQKGKSPLT